jgi:hypothetical protein
MERFRRRAIAADLQTFLLYSSDKNPDEVPSPERPLILPKGWLKVIWHGSPSPSLRLAALLNEERTTRLLPYKQEQSGLKGSIEFYMWPSRP